MTTQQLAQQLEDGDLTVLDQITSFYLFEEVAAHLDPMSKSLVFLCNEFPGYTEQMFSEDD